MKHLTSVILLFFVFVMPFSVHAQVDDLGEVIEWLEDQCASDVADSWMYCGVLELANDCMDGRSTMTGTTMTGTTMTGTTMTGTTMTGTTMTGTTMTGTTMTGTTDVAIHGGRR